MLPGGGGRRGLLLSTSVVLGATRRRGGGGGCCYLWQSRDRSVNAASAEEASISISVGRQHQSLGYHGAGNDGLYGFEVLKTAKGFRAFAINAINRSEELIAYISRLPPSDEIMKAMDEISDTVCSVMDSAELCRNTHPDREFVEEANRASMKMYDFLHLINTNHNLYMAVVKAEQNGVLPTAETERAARTLRIDFEKGGIHLCAEKLKRVNKLNNEIAQLGKEFNENIVNDPGQVDVFPASRIPKQIQHLLQPIYRSKTGLVKDLVGTGGVIDDVGFRLTTDDGTLSSILKWTGDDEVRRLAYVSGNCSPRANLLILDKLIEARHELAQILGHRSYAEFSLQHSMASSPEVVVAFLNELSETVRGRADEEVKMVREFKRQICNMACGEVEPWDEMYYMGMMKSSVYEIDPMVVASYLPLSQCLHGLKMLVKSLFGATFYTVPIAPGESWHPSILKLSLFHPDEGVLGYLYLDLYSRAGKYPGCAHFSIKGGRKLSNNEYQIPVVALVCNFSGQPGVGESRLNHWELETLFHEFGHALHSLLSRTDYQHFSGTRTVLDLAETPSNLLEYYAWDYRVLKSFAKHYSIGEVIPEKLVMSMNAAKKMFAASDLQRQVFYSVMDQELFGEQPSIPINTVALVANLKKKYTSYNNVEGTHWHCRFNHLINYGAGYYSYLYAKCLASTIWQEVCSDDPLSLSTGSMLRSKLLRHGGSRDPAEMLKEFIGESSLRNYNHGFMPNISSLQKELDF